MKAINPSSLGIYIHVPFCLQKCRYCDFYSLPLAWPVDMASYNQALLAEISLKASLYPHQSIQSIYIGGGTPSLLSPQQIQTIITVIKNSFNLNIDAEISLEANPAALHEQKMAGLLEAGINRFSLGVQSFDDEELRLMGRAHNARQAYETIELFQRQGCKNFNIDLIYGLPGQSIEKWLQNLKQAAECNPSHLSLYLLQLEEHTPMGRDAAAKKIRLPGEDIEWEMYYQAVSYLQEHGYDHYELSNFCRPGYHCRHNLLYWSACEYLGLGAGAVSFISGRRCRNLAQVETYTTNLLTGQTCPQEELETMQGQDIIRDAIILGLRLTGGIELKSFNQRFNIDLLQEFNEQISVCLSQGLLEIVTGRLRLTSKAYFLSNQVFARFLT